MRGTWNRWRERRYKKAATEERRQAILNAVAVEEMAHLLPWCDPNKVGLQLAYDNARRLTRAARWLPLISTSPHTLELACNGSGPTRRSARSQLGRAIKTAFALRDGPSWQWK